METGTVSPRDTSRPPINALIANALPPFARTRSRTLAIAAVTAMDKHRRGGEPVTDEAAEAGGETGAGAVDSWHLNSQLRNLIKEYSNVKHRRYCISNNRSTLPPFVENFLFPKARPQNSVSILLHHRFLSFGKRLKCHEAKRGLIFYDTWTRRALVKMNII